MAKGRSAVGTLHMQTALLGACGKGGGGGAAAVMGAAGKGHRGKAGASWVLC